MQPSTRGNVQAAIAKALKPAKGEALECPVCLELPSGEVHQCFNGHCLCLACWDRLERRVCPECRAELPQKNRSRAQEELIRLLRVIPATRDQEVQTFAPLDFGPQARSDAHERKTLSSLYGRKKPSTLQPMRA